MPRDLNNITAEVALLFPEVSTISYAPMISKNLETKKLDTTDLFKISYKSERLDDARKKRVLAKMQDWLRYRVSATCQVTVLTAAEKEVLIKKDAIPE
jgi:hypothetical protein